VGVPAEGTVETEGFVARSARVEPAFSSFTAAERVSLGPSTGAGTLREARALEIRSATIMAISPSVRTGSSARFIGLQGLSG
jgi:hypothetical protein